MLPDDQILLEHGAYGPYCIQVTQNINLRLHKNAVWFS